MTQTATMQAVDNYDDPSIDGRDVDYHWYRQNPDGTWSHKLGQGEVARINSLDRTLELIDTVLYY